MKKQINSRHSLLTKILVISFALSQTALAVEKQFGVVVKVKSKEVLNTKEFKDFIAKNNLTSGEYFSNLQVQSYSLKKKKGIDLVSVCKEMGKKFPDVLACEIDSKLSLNSSVETENCETPSLINKDFEKSITETIANSGSKDCDPFHKKNPKYEVPDFNPDLSPFWAQEYTGGDLLREELINNKIDSAEAFKKLSVWDGTEMNHGEHVTNLIASPYESSIVKVPTTLQYVDILKSSDFLKAADLQINNCKKNINCPRFINNSMSWGGGIFGGLQTQEAVQKLSKDHKVVVVTAASNESTIAEGAKRKSSAAGESIVVASYAPGGSSSDFTNYAAEVDISAPSNYEILTYDNQGKINKFGGTSGATPVVTSTLLAFDLIAGVKLSTPDFKQILKKTAIRHKNDPARKVTGAGYLNSYKIGAIAFKLVKLCAEVSEKELKDDCMMKHLQSDELYDFSKDVKEDKVLSAIESAYPQCGKKTPNKAQSISCEEKKEALKELRKAALLMPENLNFWDKLSCAHLAEGLSVNADYYSRLAKGGRFTDNEMARNLLLAKNNIFTADLVDLLSSDSPNSSDTININNFSILSLLVNKKLVQFVPKSRRNDKEFILESYKQGIQDFIKDAPEVLKKDKDFALEAVKLDGVALEYVSDKFKDDKSVVLAAVTQNGIAIKFASKELQKDREVVLASLKSNGSALEFASDKLKNDREVVLAAVKQRGNALKFASEELKKDRGIVLASLQSDGAALEFASDKFKNDKEVVLAAVNQNGFSLKYASKVFQKDKEVVLAALKSNGNALEHATDSFKNDKEIVLAAVSQSGRALEFASKDLQANKEVVLAAINQSGNALEFSKKFQNDKDIVLSAVKKTGRAIQYASKDLQGNKEVALEAIKQNGWAYLFVPESLKRDKDISVLIDSFIESESKKNELKP